MVLGRAPRVGGRSLGLGVSGLGLEEDGDVRVGFSTVALSSSLV